MLVFGSLISFMYICMRTKSLSFNNTILFYADVWGFLLVEITENLFLKRNGQSDQTERKVAPWRYINNRLFLSPIRIHYRTDWQVVDSHYIIKRLKTDYAYETKENETHIS